jgi:CP family cyanate transporter-like MFS transporter
MTKARFSVIVVLAVVFLSLIARPPIASMGSLLPEVVSDLNLSPSQAGLVASAPVFLFGFGAFISPWLVRKFGVNLALLLMAAVLTVSLVVRVASDFESLLAGTIGVGLAIAVINVLLPNVIRTEFKEHVAAATGLYTALFGLTASIAAAISVPISTVLGGWRISLGVWALIALAAAILWLPLIRRTSGQQQGGGRVSSFDRAAVLKSSSGLSIIGFFGLQSAGFYLMLNWLPTILVDYGYSASNAGNLLGLATIVGVPLATVSTFFFRKFTDLGILAGVISLLTAFGYLGLTIAGPYTVIGCLLVGIGQAMTFPLALTLIAIRPSTHAQVTLLSTWAQGAGYLFAAVATFSAGLIRDLTGTWSASLLLIMAIVLAQAIVGFFAGRSAKIIAQSSN